MAIKVADRVQFRLNDSDIPKLQKQLDDYQVENASDYFRRAILEYPKLHHGMDDLYQQMKAFEKLAEEGTEAIKVLSAEKEVLENRLDEALTVELNRYGEVLELRGKVKDAEEKLQECDKLRLSAKLDMKIYKDMYKEQRDMPFWKYVWRKFTGESRNPSD